MSGRWIDKTSRRARRHDCETFLPGVPEGNENDLWVCPSCRRRWCLAHKVDPTAELFWAPCFSEGVSIDGPDGSVYWRPFRARFIGRIGVNW